MALDGTLELASDAYGVSVNDAGTRLVVTSYPASNGTIVDVAPNGGLSTMANAVSTISGQSTHTVFGLDDTTVYNNDRSADRIVAYEVGSDGALVESTDAPRCRRGAADGRCGGVPASTSCSSRKISGSTWWRWTPRPGP